MCVNYIDYLSTTGNQSLQVDYCCWWLHILMLVVTHISKQYARSEWPELVYLYVGQTISRTSFDFKACEN